MVFKSNFPNGQERYRSPFCNSRWKQRENERLQPNKKEVIITLLTNGVGSVKRFCRALRKKIPSNTTDWCFRPASILRWIMVLVLPPADIEKPSIADRGCLS